MSTDGPRGTNKIPGWVLGLLVCLVVIALGATLWTISLKRSVDASQDFYRHAVVDQLSHSVVNKLDAHFTDANGDLVADPPADEKDQLDPPKLVFTYIPVPQDAENNPYPKAFIEFVQHLSQVTGKPAEYQTYTSLNDELKAMRDGQLQVAGFNTGAVPMAVDACGFVPMWKLATARGEASYRMQIIVPTDSDMRSVDDIRGHELTLTEPGSNSGYKAPLLLLRSVFQLEPGKDYVLRYSGGHDESIKGIASKQYQCAAVASDVLLRDTYKGDITQQQFRVLYDSEAFPTACFGCAYNLKPPLAEKIRQAFATFDWKSTGLEKEFANAGQSQFVPANYKDDWSLIRQIDNETGVQHKID
ncbi:MAG TPA: phosphate/phosphite/phosphonate ABC transporter substrate-binding protein [Tepidisphaeraceae bacterium]|jgi:phosphonate transport system substrate-binding protein